MRVWVHVCLSPYYVCVRGTCGHYWENQVQKCAFWPGAKFTSWQCVAETLCMCLRNPWELSGKPCIKMCQYRVFRLSSLKLIIQTQHWKSTLKLNTQTQHSNSTLKLSTHKLNTQTQYSNSTSSALRLGLYMHKLNTQTQHSDSPLTLSIRLGPHEQA